MFKAGPRSIAGGSPRDLRGNDAYDLGSGKFGRVTNPRRRSRNLFAQRIERMELRAEILNDLDFAVHDDALPAPPVILQLDDGQGHIWILFQIADFLAGAIRDVEVAVLIIGVDDGDAVRLVIHRGGKDAPETLAQELVDLRLRKQ